MNTLDVDSHDPASYTRRSQTKDDKLELLTSTWNISANINSLLPLEGGLTLVVWLRPWLHCSIKTDSVYCVLVVHPIHHLFLSVIEIKKNLFVRKQVFSEA